MPGEFEPHSGSWILWPIRSDIWHLGAKPAQGAFTQIASTLSHFEEVTMGVSRRQFENARSQLPPSVRVVEMSYDGEWIRDTGPTFVVNDKGSRRGVDWTFNAWGGLDGGCYFPWNLDDQVAEKLLEIERSERYKAPMVLEGGAIAVDGQGTLIATEECVLNPNRNRSLSRGQIEQLLADYLGVNKIIWIPRGLAGEESGGHIDNICCFLRPGVLVMNSTSTSEDPNAEILAEAYEVLSTSSDARGKPLSIHRMPSPEPQLITTVESASVDRVASTVGRSPGDRLPASYVNLYIANGCILAPQFGDPSDGECMRLLADLCPDRQIIGVPSREILFGGGNVHCNVLQLPLGAAR